MAQSKWSGPVNSTGGFKVGSNTVVDSSANLYQAGTQVTASAAELNLNDGAVAGTAVASKTLALGANKNVDVIAVADLKLGAGAGTSVTATAAEINKLSGVTNSVLDTKEMPVFLPGTSAATAGNYTIFYVANSAVEITAVREVHTTAGSDAGAVNVNIEKLTGTQAPGAGVALLTNNTNAGFDLKGTANTVQAGTLTATTANLQLAAGDRLALKLTGTPTAVASVVATVTVKRI